MIIFQKLLNLCYRCFTTTIMEVIFFEFSLFLEKYFFVDTTKLFEVEREHKTYKTPSDDFGNFGNWP